MTTKKAHERYQNFYQNGCEGYRNLSNDEKEKGLLRIEKNII